MHPLWLYGQAQQQSPAPGALAVPDTVRPRATPPCTGYRRPKQSRAQGSLYPDNVFKPFLPREVTLHSHAPPPQQDRESPTKYSLLGSSSWNPSNPSFSKMVAIALPACVLKGASERPLQVPLNGFHRLCCRDCNGDGGRTVWLDLGGSSPAPSWRKPDATYRGPDSALRYLGNERWGRQRALIRAGRAQTCCGREGAGRVLRSGVWRRGWFRRGRLACGFGVAGLGARGYWLGNKV